MNPKPIPNSAAPPERPWCVYVDDNFHYMDESSRVSRGKFSTLEEAVKVCMTITQSSVEECGGGYTQFGDDPWVMPQPSAEELANLLAEHPEWPADAFSGGYFSARAYARHLLREKESPPDSWTQAPP